MIYLAESYLDCVIFSAAVSMNCLRHLQRILNVVNFARFVPLTF